MPKEAVSVTLDADNLLWLRGRTRAAGHRSLSDTLDRLITNARTGGQAPGTVRSVVGTIDINEEDPFLLKADSIVRAEFEASLRRSGAQLAREATAPSGGSRKRPRKGRSRRG